MMILCHYMLIICIMLENKKPTGLNGHLSTDFLSEGLIFVKYQQPHHRINENQRWYRKAASKSLNTIAINVLYIDRLEDTTFSLYDLNGHA